MPMNQVKATAARAWLLPTSKAPNGLERQDSQGPGCHQSWKPQKESINEKNIPSAESVGYEQSVHKRKDNTVDLVFGRIHSTRIITTTCVVHVPAIDPMADSRAHMV